MKPTKLLLLAFLLFAVPCMAADIQITWDNPTGQAWEEVRIYKLDGTLATLKTTVLGDQVNATLTNVQAGDVYVARSYISTEVIPESVNSNQLLIGSPDPPTNLRIIVVELGEDGELSFRLVDPAEFFRS